MSPIINKDTAGWLNIEMFQNVQVKIKFRLPLSCVQHTSKENKKTCVVFGAGKGKKR